MNNARRRRTFHLQKRKEMTMDNTSYVNARCPHCEAPATIEAYSHYPGGRRLGQETLYSLETKDCECEWSHGDARRAIKALYDDVA